MCCGGPRETRDKSQPRQKDSKPEDKQNKVNEVKESTENEDNAYLGTLSGSWMLLNGFQSTHAECSLYKVTDKFSSVQQTSAHLGAISQKDNVKKIRHHVKDTFGKWKPSNVQPHGKLQVKVKTSVSATQQLQLQPIKSLTTTVSALFDTGAQMCVADWNVAKRMG